MKTLFLVTTGISMLNREKNFDGYLYLKEKYPGNMCDFEAIKNHFTDHFKTAGWADPGPAPLDAPGPLLPKAGAELRLLYFCRQKNLLNPEGHNELVFLAMDRDPDKAVVAALEGAIACLTGQNLLPPLNILEHPRFLNIDEKDPEQFKKGAEEVGRAIEQIYFTAYDQVYFAILGGMKGLLVYLAMKYVHFKTAYAQQKLGPDRFQGIPYLFENSNELILIEEDQGDIRVSTVPDPPAGRVLYGVSPGA